MAITLPGAFEKGVKNFPDSPSAGPIAAMASVYGGSLWRHLYNKFGRGKESKVEWMKGPESGSTRRGIVYVLFYMWARTNLGIKESRMFMTLFHVSWELLQEFLGSFDPFEDLFAYVKAILKFVAKSLGLNMRLTPYPKEALENKN